MNYFKNLNIDSRVELIRKSISFFFIISITLSFSLWISDRFFPLAPAFKNIPIIPAPFDYFLLALFVALLILSVFLKCRLLHIFIICLLIVVLSQDQMRWQPWVYMYFLMLIPFCFRLNSDQKSSLIRYYQIILIGIYFWSGIHKLNPNFIEITFNSILKDLLNISEPGNLKNIGYLIPAIEILTSILLMFPKARKIGVCLAITTHLFVLLYLSPVGIGKNYVVFPWNMAMITFVLILFYRIEHKILSRESWYGNWKLLIPIALIILILPSLNFIKMWDNYLSFSLYSDKLNEYYIAIEESQIDKIDKRFSDYYAEIEGLQGGQIIDVNQWAMGELKVPFYAETRVFKAIAKDFCKKGIDEDKLIFLEFEKPLLNKKYASFTCKDVND